MALVPIDHITEALARLPRQLRSAPMAPEDLARVIAYIRGLTPTLTPDVEALLALLTPDEIIGIVLNSTMPDLEATIVALESAWDVRVATGARLDAVGKKVGRARAGLDDETYRRYLLAQISVNRSSGTREEHIRIARLILDGASPTSAARIIVQNAGIATFTLTVEDVSLAATVADVLLDMLTQATSDGVRCVVQYTPDEGSAARYDTGIYDTNTYWAARERAEI